MRIVTVLLVFLANVVLSAAAFGSQVELFDRATGRVLPTHGHKGRLYVVGEPGHEYEIRIHSDSQRRLLAVTSVDGVNVISGQTSAFDQGGYVLDPHGFISIEGWRKSMSRTAAFYFTKLSDSYAARTRRPDNVGVIGVALFRERAVRPMPVPCCRDEEPSRERGAASAPSAKLDELSADKKELQRRSEPKLGTGHGRDEYSAAQYTEFERASKTPDETIVIYYDSERNLIAQGVIPDTRRYATQLPRPFPGNFVPDP